jgi:hypothetical protein
VRVIATLVPKIYRDTRIVPHCAQLSLLPAPHRAHRPPLALAREQPLHQAAFLLFVCFEQINGSGNFSICQTYKIGNIILLFHIRKWSGKP